MLFQTKDGLHLQVYLVGPGPYENIF